jgi:hypothetical protein
MRALKRLFEADGRTADEGWSVIVKGTARSPRTDEELKETGRAWLFPSTATPKPHFVDIRPLSITGRPWHWPDGCGGNGESESGSAAGRLRDGNVPSVRVRDLTHECQTDAVARAIPGGGVGLSAREAVEQRFHCAWVDAHAVVAHIDEDAVTVPT